MTFSKLMRSHCLYMLEIMKFFILSASTILILIIFCILIIPFDFILQGFIQFIVVTSTSIMVFYKSLSITTDFFLSSEKLFFLVIILFCEKFINSLNCCSSIQFQTTVSVVFLSFCFFLIFLFFFDGCF